jgi:hypothetical protein
MTIEGNNSLYQTVSELGRLLEEGHAEALAAELRAALTISSLPGEILGEIRLALKSVRRHPIYMRVDVRRIVDEGITYVDDALGVE